MRCGYYITSAVLRSWNRKKPHHFGGAGAIMRCGSGTPAPNLMFIIVGLLKIQQTVTVSSNFPIHIDNHFNHTQIRGKGTPHKFSY
jgi:hypothetical protein